MTALLFVIHNFLYKISVIIPAASFTVMMNYTRIYSGQKLKISKTLTLDQEASNHLTQVLRKKEGSLVELFDGRGSSFIAEIVSLEKKLVKVKLIKVESSSERKGIKIDLGQSLIKSEPFSHSIQKATELGVSSISPLYTERTVVKLNPDKIQSRKERWESIAKHACQQCGENWLPEINKIQTLKEWIETVNAKNKIVLYPNYIQLHRTQSGLYSRHRALQINPFLKYQSRINLKYNLSSQSSKPALHKH